MLSRRNILFFVLLSLPVGIVPGIASDDNPWSMDEPADGQQSYFDLSRDRAGNWPDQGLQGDRYSGSEFLSGKSEKRKKITGNSPFDRRGRTGKSGSGHQEQLFGYAGPRPGADQQGTSGGVPRYGAYPPEDSHSGKSAGARQSAGETGSVRFGGKLYGAFPPGEEKPMNTERQEWLAFKAQRERLRKRQSEAFSNRLPPPVPEPAPQQIRPYGGYGQLPGYGVYGVPGAGGVGQYGLLPVDPLVPGLMIPGLMW